MGAIVRKQLFVTIYCVFLYLHLLANVGLASWVTWKINNVTGQDIRIGCGQGIKNPIGQEQCTKLLGDTGKVIVWIVWFVILVELCEYMSRFEAVSEATANADNAPEQMESLL